MMKTMKKLLTVLLTLTLLVATMTIASADGEGTAYISFASSDWAVQYWFDGNDYAPVVANNKAVTGPGQYTVSLDLSGVDGGGANGIAFFDVEIAGGESLYPDNFMRIDSVKINGQSVAVGTTYTTSDNDIDTRVNLYNEWVGAVKEGRTNGLDYSQVTAVPVAVSSYTTVTRIEVTFTLISASGDGGSTVMDGGSTQTTGTLPQTSGIPMIMMAISGVAISGFGLKLRKNK
jgi:hypothetical protein